jgi:hypothetical protein
MMARENSKSPQACVKFIPVMEVDEIVAGCDFPPRPATIRAAVAAYIELIEAYGLENVIAIAPFKDKSAGVKELNKSIRVALGFDELAQAGDLLMITKNDHDKGILNGQRYRVTSVKGVGHGTPADAGGSVPGASRASRGAALGKGKGSLISAVLLGTGHRITLTANPHANARGPCADVDWGYVATVHKFQGSEADAVLVVVPSGTLRIMRSIGGEKTPWFFDRSCLYTACSRPKLALVLVGDPDDIKAAAELNQSVRITALPRLLSRLLAMDMETPLSRSRHCAGAPLS